MTKGQFYTAVRTGVRADSKGQQVPWESTSLETAFPFRATRVAVSMPAMAAKPAAAPSARRAVPASIGAPPALAVGDTWTYRLVNQLDQREPGTSSRRTT